MYFSLGIVLLEIIFQDELRCCPSTATNRIDYLLIWDKYAQLQLAVVNFSMNEHCTTFASQEIITNVAARKKVLTKFSFNILVPRSSEAYLEPSQRYKMAFFVKIVSDFQPFIIFCKQLHLRCLTRFWLRPWTYSTKNKDPFFFAHLTMPQTKFFWDIAKKKIKQNKTQVFAIREIIFCNLGTNFVKTRFFPDIFLLFLCRESRM